MKIPKGVNSGINLRMHKKGHFSPTGPSGDLLLKITVKPHQYFKRDGFDILTDAYISVTDAILGGEVTVKTLSTEVKLKVDPGTQDNTKKKLVGLGIQKLPPNQNLRGNQIVTFKVRIPKSVSAEQRRVLEEYRSIEERVKSGP